VSRLYTLDAANTLVPDVAAVAARLRDERHELVGLRNAYRDRETVVLEALIASDAEDPTLTEGDDPDLRRLRLRMRGLVDQMQADVAWLDDRSIVLRDIGTGLVDFPARAGGRMVWLCWRLGEDVVAFGHATDEGFAARRPVSEILAEPA
jgi:hypothetical protein